MIRPTIALASLFATVAVSVASAQTSTPASLAGARLIQATLPSRDLAKSTIFYRDVLGLQLLFQVPGAVFFDAGSVRLRLEQSSSAAPAVGELYFDDPGLSRVDGLNRRGVKFVGPAETVQRTPTSELKLIEFYDPDGNALGLLGAVDRK